MRKKILAGNWKMNKSIAETKDYFEVFFAGTKTIQDQINHKFEMIFAVPFPYLSTAQAAVQGRGVVAAQNVHFEKSGAYTGEVSCPMLRDIGISCTLVGHSERRQYFGDSDEVVSRKVKATLDHGILPIACLGEKKEERVGGQTFQVLQTQLDAILAPVEPSQNIILAYEPVWAIGTGLTATDEQAQEAHAFIRRRLRETKGEAFAEKTRILYGGSVNGKNVAGLISQPDIDGGLVGGASLNPEEFAVMANIVAGAK